MPQMSGLQLQQLSRLGPVVTIPVIAEEGIVSLSDQLSLCAIMNSFCYDFIVRTRMTGINLNKFILRNGSS